MSIIKSVVEKSGAKGAFWIAVIDNEEILCFDPICKTLEGKENPYEIATSGTGKKFLKVPKQGGFQGKSGGGGWKGKSDKELHLQALTMCLSYAKDVAIAELTHRSPEFVVQTYIMDTYKVFSKQILDDLKRIEGEAPKQEVPKTADKPSNSTPQERSAYQPPSDTANLTVKQKLEKKMWQHLQNQHADNAENFRTLLIELTEFEGKDGKKVFVDNFDKLSDKWAGSAIGKLEKLIEEDEYKTSLKPTDDDIPY